MSPKAKPKGRVKAKAHFTADAIIKKRRQRKPKAVTAPLTPTEKKLRWRLSIRRAVKVFIYNLGAWGIALGMLIFAVIALHEDVPAEYIALAQIPLAALLAGAHKHLEFKGKALGIDPPEVMLPPGNDVASLVAGAVKEES